MCICFFQINSPSDEYPFIFCGNRDEFFSRQSLALHEWTSGVLGGRDQVRGGMWLGIKPDISARRSSFRFAVVHNFRHADVQDVTKLSRGDLVVDFINGDMSAGDYAAKVAHEGFKYMGFTLILVDETGAYFTSNRGTHRKLGVGKYALANSLLDTPWEKVVLGKQLFETVLSRKSTVPEEEFISQLLNQVLRNNKLHPSNLPGILDVNAEIYLSGIFIEPYKWNDSGFYGTRMQTIILARGDGSIIVEEHSMDVETRVKDWIGKWSTIRFDTRKKKHSLL